MRLSLVVGGAALALALGLSKEREAAACGGCFLMGEQPTVVTDHRMVFSISKTRSTLYDQIQYTGDPAQFAWVLPISGTVTVGLSADVVFQAMNAYTQTVILPPPRNCPGPPSGCFSSTSSSSGGSSSSSSGSGGVNVYRQEVVGPYETVQLSASSANALQTWLTDNGFRVPPDVAPVIAKYQAENFNFLALKLAPSKGVQDMRPVRVTTEGANVALPLRMIAAGTGANVGLTLWVLGEGRYEPQNFGSFVIQASDLAWDWQQNRSNYTDLRAQKTAAGGGKVWEIENTRSIAKDSITGQITFGGASADSDYLPIKDSGGNVTRTASQVRDDDLATLLNGISGVPRITRLRADLAKSALDADLVLKASSDQSEVDTFRQVTKELNAPLCPVYQGCSPTGEQKPRDQLPGGAAINGGTANGAVAPASGGNGGETFTCAASSRHDDALSAVGLGVIGVAAAFGLRQRHRRRPPNA